MSPLVQDNVYWHRMNVILVTIVPVPVLTSMVSVSVNLTAYLKLIRIIQK